METAIIVWSAAARRRTPNQAHFTLSVNSSGHNKRHLYPLWERTTRRFPLFSSFSIAVLWIDNIEVFSYFIPVKFSPFIGQPASQQKASASCLSSAISW
jgi:hypothetical protein